MAIKIEFSTTGGEKRFHKYVEKFREASKELNESLEAGVDNERITELLSNEKTAAFLLATLVTDPNYLDITEIKDL